MNRASLIPQLREACTLEDKFIVEFDSFLKEHVLENYHLLDAEKDFVESRIKNLQVDSRKHLQLFKDILEKVEESKDQDI